MEHGGNAAEDDLYPLFSVTIRDFPAAFDLDGQHDRNADEIRRFVKIDRLHIFVDKNHLDVIRQGCGKYDRTVGRQVKFCLAVEFGPLGINQNEFHSWDPLYASTVFL